MNDVLTDLTVSDAVRKELSSFCDRVKDVLGEDLVSIILYGPIAKGVSSSAHVSVMLVVGDVSANGLSRISQFVRRKTKEYRMSVMVVTEIEIERSTDVFPIKFLDMQNFHVVLHGKSVFDEVLVGGDNLRLRCEQQARNTLLRLRSQFVYRSDDADRLRTVLSSATTAFLTTLNAFFFLVNGSFRASEAEIATVAKDMLKLDSDVLLEVVEIKNSGTRVDADKVRGMLELLMAAVGRGVDIMDRFTPQDS